MAAVHGHFIITPIDGAPPIVMDTWQCCHCGRHCIREPGKAVRATLAKLGLSLDGTGHVVQVPNRCWKCQRPTCNAVKCREHATAAASGTICTPLEGFSGPGFSWGG